MTSDFSGMGREMEILKQLDTALEIAGASEVFLRTIDPLSNFNG